MEKRRDTDLIKLSEFVDDRGKLVHIQAFSDVPFRIERVFYIHSVPPLAERGGHAHKECWQFIVAVSGEVRATTKTHGDIKTRILNKPNVGLLVKPGTHVTLSEFTSNAVCLVLASQVYLESDYSYEYEETYSIPGFTAVSAN